MFPPVPSILLSCVSPEAYRIEVEEPGFEDPGCEPSLGDLHVYFGDY